MGNSAVAGRLNCEWKGFEQLNGFRLHGALRWNGQTLAENPGWLHLRKAEIRDQHQGRPRPGALREQQRVPVWPFCA